MGLDAAPSAPRDMLNFLSMAAADSEHQRWVRWDAISAAAQSPTQRHLFSRPEKQHFCGAPGGLARLQVVCFVLARSERPCIAEALPVAAEDRAGEVAAGEIPTDEPLRQPAGREHLGDVDLIVELHPQAVRLIPGASNAAAN